MTRRDSIGALVALGFTGLEAEVYALLVKESPATGYRVAKALGKAAANVYKAIESLEHKGAVMVDDGAARLCRPVPIREVLALLERRFERSRRRATAAVEAITSDEGDDRVYRLRAREQVLERARTMIARSEAVILVDVFPEPFEEIRDALEDAVRRGVDVAAQLYAPGEIPGAEVSMQAGSAHILEHWPGEQLNLVTDATCCLLALLARDRGPVLQAVWSESTYISCLMHATQAADIVVGRLTREVEEGASIDQLRRTIRSRRRLIAPENPGYRALIDRYGDDATSHERLETKEAKEITT